MTYYAYTHIDEGKTWIRIVEGSTEWDEPIAGWERILDLVNGGMYLQQGSRKYIEGAPNWSGA